MHASSQNQDNNRKMSDEAKQYWYDGKAEISTFQLTQARYGELREGTASLVYVTEPFSRTSNTKADKSSSDNVPVLKLNKTHKFITGVYPYSLMASSFFPVEDHSTSLKLASSIQEWCGMTYLEMKNEGNLRFSLDSYFEGESFQDKKLNTVILEDDLWSLLRLHPDQLPVGKLAIVPSMFYLQLRHIDLDAYEAFASIEKTSDNTVHYSIQYPSLERSLSIQFDGAFPHAVKGWKESYFSGYGSRRQRQESTGTLINAVKLDYWNKNRNADAHWREELGI